MENKIVPSGKLTLQQIGIDPYNLNTNFPNREQRIQYRAVVQWLTDYQPTLDANNLDKVKGFLEAFYHLSNVQDDKNRCILINEVRLNTLDKECLLEQMAIWGYYDRLSDILKSLLVRDISPYISGICHLFLGSIAQNKGQKDEAFEYFDKSIEFAKKSGRKDLESRCLMIMGNFYRLKENYDKAINFFDKGLSISSQSNNRLWEAVILGFMGLIFDSSNFEKNNFEVSENYYLKALSIISDLGNSQWQSNILTNLAVLYMKNKQQYVKAEKILSEGLVIAQKGSDRYAEAWALYQLGLLYKKKLDYSTFRIYEVHPALAGQAIQAYQCTSHSWKVLYNQSEEFLKSSKKIFKVLGTLAEQKQVEKELVYLAQVKVNGQ